MKHNPFERLPDTVEIGGKPVRIDPDFRVGVAIETELLSDEPDVEGLLRAFYPDGIPADVEAAADRMIWFYAHTDEAGGDAGDTPRGGTARWYDFAQDADALMASFQQAYGIDLERDSLHWWKFRRLMFAGRYAVHAARAVPRRGPRQAAQGAAQALPQNAASVRAQAAGKTASDDGGGTRRRHEGACAAPVRGGAPCLRKLNAHTADMKCP